MIGKICHLTSVHQRYDNRIFNKECTSLAANDWETHLVVADGKGDEIKNGVHIWDVGRPAGRWSRFFRASKNVYKKGLELDAEIYHFHDPELIPWALKLRRRSKKVIYDAHEIYRLQIRIRTWIPGIIRGPLAYFFGLYEDFAARKFNGIVVPQLGMIDNFKHLNANTVHIANSMVIDEEFDLTNKDYSNGISFHPGSLTRPRGVLNMVNAFADLEDNELILAGSFDENGLMEEVSSLPGWKHVNYVGKLPFEKVKEYHKKASIGLILFENVAQCYHAYTVKLFEYMYYGTPVLMPDFGEWLSFNEIYKCGINVDTGNATEVSETIRYLNANPSVKAELGRNGQKAVKEALNWKVDEEKLLNFYDSISA